MPPEAWHPFSGHPDNVARLSPLGDIQFIGNLFRSKSVDKNNAELWVTVTQQLVSTMTEDDLSEEIVFPEEWLQMGVPEVPASETGSEGE